MKDISIYTLTSQLHDEQAVAASTQEFLGSPDIEYDMRGADFADYGQAPLSLTPQPTPQLNQEEPRYVHL